MEIKLFDNYNTMSKKAAEYIFNNIEKKSDSLICPATGNSTIGTYNELKKKYDRQPNKFSKMRLIKLDEWGGINLDHPSSCETALQKMLVSPLKIDSNRFISFDSNPENKTKECNTVQEKLNEIGPIDLCILGLGINGHIAFNEPAEYLQPNCHIADLSSKSLEHTAVKKLRFKPNFGITLGMADIIHSRSIIILLTGPNKEKIIEKFLSRNISTYLPASFLWLHPNVTCLINKSDYSNYYEINYKSSIPKMVI